MILRALCFLLSSLAVAPAAEEAREWAGLKFHAVPKALPAGAVTEDWPRFLGAGDAPVSRETGVVREFTEAGPAKVWQCAKGEGYASPAISGGRLVLFHRVGGREKVDCLEAVTGRRFWSHEYDVDYRDDYGYNAGPRAGPVISGGRVVTFGVTSWLKCFDLATGRVVWEHDCQEEFGVMKYFFGSGASPLIHGDNVIVHLGGSEDRCVGAFSLADGKLAWMTKHAWGQSYASPVMMKVNGKDRVLVFAGGKSKPSTGGLLSIDPATGAVEGEFFWRAPRFPSVNAQTPVRCGDGRVFISQAYVDDESGCNGGVMLKADAAGKWSPVWKAADFGCHWMTPVYHEGCLYGFSGEKDKQCELVCHDAETGARKWAEKFSWPYAAGGQNIPMGFYRGSLLKVGDRFLCLGEWGTLAWLELSSKGAKVLSKHQPCVAQESWTLPALSQGLLYVSQNQEDKLNGAPPSLLCYDLRAASPAK